MSKPVLHYFKGRGRAETVRLMMAACGVEWTDGPYMNEPSQIAKMRKDGDLMFDQVPLLEIDGMKMVQSMAIVRYLEAKHGLRAADIKDQAKIEMLAEGCRDFLSPYIARGFAPEEAFRAGIKKANERYMPIFQKQLGTNQYLVGNKLSMADVLLFECLLNVQDCAPECLDKYINLKTYCTRLSSEPNFAKYMASDQRFPPNHAVYIAEVRCALSQ